MHARTPTRIDPRLKGLNSWTFWKMNGLEKKRRTAIGGGDKRGMSKRRMAGEMRRANQGSCKWLFLKESGEARSRGVSVEQCRRDETSEWDVASWRERDKKLSIPSSSHQCASRCHTLCNRYMWMFFFPVRLSPPTWAAAPADGSSKAL